MSKATNEGATCAKLVSSGMYNNPYTPGSPEYNDWVTGFCKERERQWLSFKLLNDNQGSPL